MGILSRVRGLFTGTGEEARKQERRRMEAEARETAAAGRSQRKRAKALREAGIEDVAKDLEMKSRINEEHARSVQEQILNSFGASRGRF